MKGKNVENQPPGIYPDAVGRGRGKTDFQRSMYNVIFWDKPKAGKEKLVIYLTLLKQLSGMCRGKQKTTIG